MPLDIEVRLNLALFARGLITRRDYERRPNDVMAAVLATFKVDAQRIQGLFANE